MSSSTMFLRLHPLSRIDHRSTATALLQHTTHSLLPPHNTSKLSSSPAPAPLGLNPHRSRFFSTSHITSSNPIPTNGATSDLTSDHHHPSGWLVDASDPVRTDYDAIMMLGGGLWEGGKLPPWVIRRLEGALHLYEHQAGRKCPIVLLGAGTPHKRTVLNPAGYVLHESTAYAAYLMKRGVPAKDLLKECQSYDTVGNGYFSLVMHALPAGWKRIAIVTSDFHMPRTRAIFNTCYSLSYPHTSASVSSHQFSLSYHPVSDQGLFDDEVIQARAIKEAAAVTRWQKDVGHFTSLAELHRWLFATHLCYSASRQHEFGVAEDLDPKLAATY